MLKNASTLAIRSVDTEENGPREVSWTVRLVSRDLGSIATLLPSQPDRGGARALREQSMAECAGFWRSHSCALRLLLHLQNDSDATPAEQTQDLGSAANYRRAAEENTSIWLQHV